LAQTGVHYYSGNHIELGNTAEKVHIDPSDSDIVRSMPEQTGENNANFFFKKTL
jgi:large subunit ribosomal protein L30e